MCTTRTEPVAPVVTGMRRTFCAATGDVAKITVSSAPNPDKCADFINKNVKGAIRFRIAPLDHSTLLTYS
jgi:hypothetical protein